MTGKPEQHRPVSRYVHPGIIEPKGKVQMVRVRKVASMAKIYDHSERVLYSISQVNAITGVGAPTIRKWESAFEDYLAVVRTEGGQRRFNKEAVEKIELLKTMIYEEGLSLEGARRRLEHLDAGETDNPVTDQTVEKLADMVSELLIRKLFREGVDPPGGIGPPGDPPPKRKAWKDQ